MPHRPLADAIAASDTLLILGVHFPLGHCLTIPESRPTSVTVFNIQHLSTAFTDLLHSTTFFHDLYLSLPRAFLHLKSLYSLKKLLFQKSTFQIKSNQIKNSHNGFSIRHRSSFLPTSSFRKSKFLLFHLILNTKY
jgi:hypothetical protein